MASVPLETAGTAIANAAGVATIYLAPVPTWAAWDIDRMTVNAGGTSRPQVGVYRGTIADSSRVEGTNNGWNNTSDTRIALKGSEQLVVQFTGCTPGATATVTVSGTQTVPD